MTFYCDMSTKGVSSPIRRFGGGTIFSSASSDKSGSYYLVVFLKPMLLVEANGFFCAALPLLFLTDLIYPLAWVGSCDGVVAVRFDGITWLSLVSVFVYYLGVTVALLCYSFAINF